MLITGGAGGIGRGLVNYFINQGAVVAATCKDAASAAGLSRDEKDARVYELDVCDVPSIEPLFSKVVSDLGRIDILVNCAGMGRPIPALKVTREDWDDMMNLNLRGAFFCAQAAAKHMLPRKYGRIINISSQISLVANKDEVAYCASKGGMNQMTRVLALEWGCDGVIVSAVAPTFTRTPGTAERLDTPEFLEATLAKIPRGRLGTIADVASAVHYLASDEADMANGEVLVIDGGWTIV
jgi:NAD(P)-dependent dehydrogenase (short-subunit alcohol dehydrogenase family)